MASMLLLVILLQAVGQGRTLMRPGPRPAIFVSNYKQMYSNFALTCLLFVYLKKKM